MNSFPSLIYLLLFLFLFFLNLLQVQSLTYPAWNGIIFLRKSSSNSTLGFQLNELNAPTLFLFQLQAQLWTSSGLVSSTNISFCGANNPILGGVGILNYNAILTRTLSNLPPHTSIFFQLTFSLIDSLQASDSFSLTFDGVNIPGGSNLGQKTPYFMQNSCGNSYDDTTEYVIMGSFLHSSSSLTMQITSLVSSSGGAIGLRDLSISLSNKTSLPTPSSCYRLDNSIVFGFSGECECSQGSYYSTFVCFPCSSSCLDCYGSSASQCYSCAPGYSFDGTSCVLCHSSCLTCSGTSKSQCVTCKYPNWKQRNGTCTSSCNLPVKYQQVVDTFQVCTTECRDFEYMLPNKTCITNSCPYPLVLKIIDDNNLCVSPCPNTGDYYNLNTLSCVSDCWLPWVQGQINDVDTCSQPCDIGEFYYWNDTCQNNCPFPLEYSLMNGIDICEKPCLDDSDFYYWNTSCFDTCPSPFLQTSWSDVKFCDLPCNPNSKFLYPNGSCYDTCTSPMKSTSIGDIKECSNPCSDPNEYYYPSDESCQSECLSPNITQYDQSIKICILGAVKNTETISSEETEMVDTVSDATKGTGTAATVGVMASSLVNSGSPNAITLISLIKMLEYIRYININYPPKLQYMLDHQSQDFISAALEDILPQRVREKFPKYPLPGRFAENKELDSSFILNYWNVLLAMGLTGMALIISILVAKVAKRIKFIVVVSEKIRDLIQWNLFLMIICSNIDGVGVFSSLELRNTHFNSTLAVVGTLTCISMNILVAFLLMKIPYIIYCLQRSKYKVFPMKTVTTMSESFPVQRYQSYNVLFSTFQNASFLKQSCMFFTLFRIYLFNIIIGYLFEYPLTQTFLITFMSVLMLLYLSIQKPYRSRLELFKMITYEGILLIINFSILILALLDDNNIEATSFRIRLGDIVIITNMLFSLVAVAFMVFEVVFKVIKGWKARKNIGEKGLKYWFGILKSILQPEEMEGISENKPSNPRDFIKGKSPPEMDSDTALHLNLQGLENQSNSFSPSKKLLRHRLSLFSSPQNHTLNSTFQELILTPKTNSPPVQEREGNNQFFPHLNYLTRGSSPFFQEDNLETPKKILTTLNAPESPEKSGFLSPSKNKLIRSSFSRLSFPEASPNNTERRQRVNRGGRPSLVSAELSKKFSFEDQNYALKNSMSRRPSLISIFKPQNKENS